MMNRTSTIIIVLILFLSIWMGCDITSIPPAPTRDNPFDDRGENFNAPEVLMTDGPLDRSTIDTDFVRFVWKNRYHDDNSLFSFRRDSGGWSEFDTARTAQYDFLEEGAFQFQVRSKYRTGQEQTNPVTVNLVVNAIKGPAIRFVPKKLTIFRQSAFSVDIAGEELPVCGGAKFVVRYNPKRFRLADTITLYKDSRSLFARGGGTVIDFIERNETAGTVILTTAVAGGVPDSVSGTGLFARLHFTAIVASAVTDSIILEQSTTLRTVANSVITLRKLVPAIVEVR